MTNYVKELCADLWYSTRALRVAFGPIVVVADIVREKRSVALACSPSFPYLWMARLWAWLILKVEAYGGADYVTIRYVSPERAAQLRVEYQDWLDTKNAAVGTYAQQLSRWARHKNSAKG